MKRVLAVLVFIALTLQAPRGAVAASAPFFPGVYPAVTASYAAVLQAQVNHGKKRWLLDARLVATAFAGYIHWPAAAKSAAVISRAPTGVTVSLRNRSTPAFRLFVHLVHAGSGRNAIWEVKSCRTTNLALIDPIAGARVTTPVRVTGTAQVFEGQFSLRMLDGRWRTIGQRAVHVQGQRVVPFITRLAFRARGADGIVEALSHSPKDGSLLNVSITKVRLG